MSSSFHPIKDRPAKHHLLSGWLSSPPAEVGEHVPEVIEETWCQVLPARSALHSPPAPTLTPFLLPRDSLAPWPALTVSPCCCSGLGSGTASSEAGEHLILVQTCHCQCRPQCFSCPDASTPALQAALRWGNGLELVLSAGPGVIFNLSPLGSLATLRKLIHTQQGWREDGVKR